MQSNLSKQYKTDFNNQNYGIFLLKFELRL